MSADGRLRAALYARVSTDEQAAEGYSLAAQLEKLRAYCDINDYEKLVPIDDVYIIGHITKPEFGAVIVGRNGEEMMIQAQGWKAF
jgi:predicted site-specific integrase-resolvase